MKKCKFSVAFDIFFKLFECSCSEAVIPFIIVMEPGKECGHIGILTGITVYISESHIVVQLFVRSFKFSDVKVF